MKTKIIQSALLLLLFPAFLFAQVEKKKTEVIYIQTSAICETCKGIIESAVKKVNGVKRAELNLANKNLMVEFKTNKTSADAIKFAISKSGYDADEVKADTTAYKNLPLCCRKDEK